MGFLLKLIPSLSGINPKLVITLALLIGLGGWGWYKTYQVNRAQEAVVKTQKELRDVAQQLDEANAARDKAIEANKTASATIASLRQEKLNIQTALNNLAADRAKSQKALLDLTAAINASRNDPANKTALSPVMKMTIDTIQKSRDARSAK